MKKRNKYVMFSIESVHAPDSALVNTNQPGWRENAKERGHCFDENDLQYSSGRNANNDQSTIKVDIRCGTPPAIVVQTLRKIADLIERDGEGLLSQAGELYDGYGDVKLIDGALHVPSVEPEEIDSPSAAVA